MLTRSLAIAALLAGGSLFPSGAHSADMATKAAPSQGCAQAVDGVNGTLGGFGGDFANKAYEAAQGSLAVPLGCSFGAQVDLTGGNFDGRFIGIAAGHLFWRNPAQGLLGVYGDYTDWNQFGGVHVGHVGAEAESYNGRWTLQGIAGAEFGNTASGTVGSVVQTFSVPTRFFDEFNIAYYPTDNLEVYAGHRYLGGNNALALGGEWGIPMSSTIMPALFAEARFGDHADHGAVAGMRFYFGEKDKTLIRRHREDDPTNWNNGPDSFFASGTQTGAPTTCSPPNVISNGQCRPPPT